jgi:hypothetical protein
MKNLFTLLILAFFTNSVFAADPVSHSSWDALMKKHVSAKGNVNYKGFKADKADLEAYLKLISDNAPKKDWTAKQKKAYWMNAYNAYTVKLIVDYYPIKSIKDVPGFGGPWKQKFFKIGGMAMDLEYIEHSVLRKEFDDPRIHFGINCASYSCPRLSNIAFTEENVESELEKLAKEFVNDPTKNKITADKIEISEIFKWFTGDFTKKGTLIDYLNKYSTVKINPKAKVTYMTYNWNLNE